MRLTWRWLVAVALAGLLAGFLLGRAGSGATAKELAQADSLRAQAHALVVADAERDSLWHVTEALRADSITRATRVVTVTRTHTDSVVRTIPDTQYEAGLETALEIERAAEDSLTTQLARDTTELLSVVHGVTAERDMAMQLQVKTQSALDAALRVRKDPAWGIGVTAGYGCGAHACGPQITAGVTFHVRVPFLNK